MIAFRSDPPNSVGSVQIRARFDEAEHNDELTSAIEKKTRDVALALSGIPRVQHVGDHFLGFPVVPEATLTVIAAESFALFGSDTVPETVAVFVIVVLPLTSTVT